MGAAVISIVASSYLAGLRECIRLHEEMAEIHRKSIALQKDTIGVLTEMLAIQERRIADLQMWIVATSGHGSELYS